MEAIPPADGARAARAGREGRPRVASDPLPSGTPVDYRFRSRLDRGEWVVSVEVDPPHGLDVERAIGVVARLQAAGVDCVDAGDSPLASVRMSPVLFAVAVQQRTGVETIIHFTSRDRNLMALQSDLLGAHMLGVRSLIALSGDPPILGRYANATGVWDVKAEGLIELVAGLNAGHDSAGNDLGGQTAFTIATAANPNAGDLATEITRLRAKAARGAHVFLTQPGFDAGATERFLERAAPIGLPVVLGVMPLVSERNARYVQANTPGISIGEAVIERLARAGEGAAEEGLAIATEYLQAVRPMCAGVYLIPMLNRFKGITELVRRIKAAG